MWHLWTEFSEFKLPLLLVPQNNSINLDVKSTGMEIKRHHDFLHQLLIDRGEGLKARGVCVCGKELCSSVESHMGSAGLHESSAKELRFADAKVV